MVCTCSAYKLGKNKCSYNQVQLNLLHPEDRSKKLEVVETAEDSTVQPGDNGIYYFAKLRNGTVVKVVIYAVYANPAAMSGGKYEWTLVKREHCKKSCRGRILKPIQRFGRLGRRNSLNETDNLTAKDMWKETKHLFIAIDEASTHLAEHNGTQKVRLLFGILNPDNHELLGASVSGPIRVLANNDVPKGAASIVVDANISKDWEGWSAPAQDSTPLTKGATRSPLATIYPQQESPSGVQVSQAAAQSPPTDGFATPAPTLPGSANQKRNAVPSRIEPNPKRTKSSVDAQRKLSLDPPPTPKLDTVENVDESDQKSQSQDMDSKGRPVRPSMFLPPGTLAADSAYAAYMSHYSVHPALMAQAQDQYWKCIEAWRAWYSKMMPVCIANGDATMKGGKEEHALPTTPAPIRMSKAVARRESL
mmetsp:Transcript_10497/g.64291  ORF Transcript_10497/g.64291 Transcript_10497/m.64291 type:complete len:420 (-) Transcript_10497:8107-9366(-)